MTPSVYLGEDVFKTLEIGRKITNLVWVNSGLFKPREETGRSKQADDLYTDFYIRIYQFINELDGIESKEIEENKLPPAGGEIHGCEQYGLLCGGGRSSFVVDWKGTMMPCNRMDMICSYPLQDGFKEAWDTINKAACNWPRASECQGCAYHDICNRCAANMLMYAEPGKQPKGLCEKTKLFVQHGVNHIPECD